MAINIKILFKVSTVILLSPKKPIITHDNKQHKINHRYPIISIKVCFHFKNFMELCKQYIIPINDIIDFIPKVS